MKIITKVLRTALVLVFIAALDAAAKVLTTNPDGSVGISTISQWAFKDVSDGPDQAVAQPNRRPRSPATQSGPPLSYLQPSNSGRGRLFICPRPQGGVN